MNETRFFDNNNNDVTKEVQSKIQSISKKARLEIQNLGNKYRVEEFYIPFVVRDFDFELPKDVNNPKRYGPIKSHNTKRIY